MLHTKRYLLGSYILLASVLMNHPVAIASDVCSGDCSNLTIVDSVKMATNISHCELSIPHQQDSLGRAIVVGVLELNTNNLDQNNVRSITERVRYHVGNSAIFHLIERQKMVEIMEEHGFQLSGACDTDECVVQVGKILGAQKMITGHIDFTESVLTLEVSLVDIVSTIIEHKAIARASSITDILEISTRSVVGRLARDVAEDVGLSSLLPTTLTLISYPKGAKIIVDGEIQIQVTPDELRDLQPGTHNIEVTAPGYYTWRESVRLESGGDTEIQFVLKPKSRFKAGVLSLIVPGLGQYYSGRPVTGALMAGGNLSLLIITISVYTRYSELKNEQSTLLSRFRDVDTLSELFAAQKEILNKQGDIETYHDRLKIIGMVHAGFWLLNAIETWIFMPRLNSESQNNPLSITGSCCGAGGFKVNLTIAF